VAEAKNAMIDVSVIIVGTNEKEHVMQCLDSLLKSVTGYKIKAILVDNASADGTSAAVEERFRDVKILRNEEKKGYIYSNNLAMKGARGRYILIVNSDITFEPDTLEIMLDFMERRPSVAVSACRLTFEDGTLQLTCRRFPTPLTYISRLPHLFRWIKSGKKFAMSAPVRRYLMMDYDHKKARGIDWALSAFFLMRKKAIDEIGMFDEGLVSPFYLEDVDWCFRAHLRGWEVFYVPEANAVHHYKRGSVKKLGKLSFVHMANILIFYNKHALSMLLGRHRRHRR